MRPMYTYKAVKHWWDTGTDPVSRVVRKHGKVHLAAAFIGASESTFTYWRNHRIPVRAFRAFQAQGITASMLLTHNRRYGRVRLTDMEYQRYYYVSVTRPKRLTRVQRARSNGHS